MDFKLDKNWTNLILIMLIFIVLIVSIRAFIWYTLELCETGKTPEIILSALLVIGVIALILTLTFAALVYQSRDLSDPKQALGLPEGSIRAIIALSLILIFMISSVLLYERVNFFGEPLKYESSGITEAQLNDIPKEEIKAISRYEIGNRTFYNVTRVVERNKTGEDIAKQIITTVSTLVVAVAGFYFGSKTVGGATGGAPAVSVPVIRSVDPVERKREEEFWFKIFGKNFDLAKEVKLVHDSKEIQCTEVTSSSTIIKCKLKIPKDISEYPAGKWTVVVINSDKGEDRLEAAFTVRDT